jgi:ubiquinone/menaquinone biosynthesis C-methylase UbiE
MVMNSNHAKLCPSPEWAEHIQRDILPTLTRDVDLGEAMLEIGPGPGAATGWLADKVAKLTAVEIDPDAAQLLADRYVGTNVEIISGSAAELDVSADTFDSAGCFTMLHHVRTAALQTSILAETFRVLRPGGFFIGSDSLASDDLHHFHAGDTYNPIEPASLLIRLQTIGFWPVTVTVTDSLLFIAGKPGSRGGGPHGPSSCTTRRSGGSR